MLDLAHTQQPQYGTRHAMPGLRLFFAEYRRALAAADYHAGLRRMSTTDLAECGVARPDIPRRVFEEFYGLAPDDWRREERAAAEKSATV